MINDDNAANDDGAAVRWMIMIMLVMVRQCNAMVLVINAIVQCDNGAMQ